MQVSGRAARNINGKVILYGDIISEAMQYLIDETTKRRKLQITYNKINNIEPKTILKSKDEIKNTTVIASRYIDEIIEIDKEIDVSDFDAIESKDIAKKIERKMLNYAKELRFEEAALLRDQLNKIKSQQEGLNNV